MFQNGNRTLHEANTIIETLIHSRHGQDIVYTCKTLTKVRQVRYKSENHFLTKLRLKIRDVCSKKEVSLKCVFVIGKRTRPEDEKTGEMLYKICDGDKDLLKSFRAACCRRS